MANTDYNLVLYKPSDLDTISKRPETARYIRNIHQKMMNTLLLIALGSPKAVKQKKKITSTKKSTKKK